MKAGACGFYFILFHLSSLRFCRCVHILRLIRHKVAITRILFKDSHIIMCSEKKKRVILYKFECIILSILHGDIKNVNKYYLNTV